MTNFNFKVFQKCSNDNSWSVYRVLKNFYLCWLFQTHPKQSRIKTRILSFGWCILVFRGIFLASVYFWNNKCWSPPFQLMLEPSPPPVFPQGLPWPHIALDPVLFQNKKKKKKSICIIKYEKLIDCWIWLVVKEWGKQKCNKPSWAGT